MRIEAEYVWRVYVTVNTDNGTVEGVTIRDGLEDRRSSTGRFFASGVEDSEPANGSEVIAPEPPPKFSSIEEAEAWLENQSAPSTDAIVVEPSLLAAVKAKADELDPGNYI